MDGKMLARLGAVVFVAVTVVATALELTRKEDRSAIPSVGQSEAGSADSLRGDLIRCRELGEAGTRDPACLRIWAENRRRFLAPAPPAIDRPEAR
ncbi:putative entry exclusion protein TrbK-alt [Mesorhizobium kowhaii]|uniref:Conjugal transfer protein TrbK n=1 Tax=Mesorhizobium kowhaii TaxID=1300272 RepID=A0A2W7BZY5_9HYPH|nr:putative entry exclusion protein TrbK-alt [Mesorhizobium kowhaii]PZV36400.1 conjugal transfer protein TrbK [Mesorhizobium kowhaii]